MRVGRPYSTYGLVGGFAPRLSLQIIPTDPCIHVLVIQQVTSGFRDARRLGQGGGVRACSTIWAVDRLARSPMRPVKQNWQFCAQPTCELTHSVVRARAPASRRSTGMITASTADWAPSPSCRVFYLFLSMTLDRTTLISKPTATDQCWFNTLLLLKGLVAVSV